MEENDRIFGLLAEFEDHEELLEAVRQARAEGYRRMDAYSPFPVDGLAEALGLRTNSVPFWCLVGGIGGGLTGYGMQLYAMAIDYPLNVGGRPLNSWPMFIPITFELTILGAALSAVFAMFVLNRLPEPYHPVFGAAGFDRASVDRFFLLIQADDPIFEIERALRFLWATGAAHVEEVLK